MKLFIKKVAMIMRSSRVRKFKSPYRTFIFVSKLFLIWYLLLFTTTYLNQPTDAIFTESYVVESKIQGKWENEKKKPKAEEVKVVEEEEQLTENEKSQEKVEEEVVENETEETQNPEEVIEEVNDEEKQELEEDETTTENEDISEEKIKNTEEKEDPESDEEEDI